MADKIIHQTIVGIETGYSEDPRFTVFRFDVTDNLQKPPKKTEWFAIQQEGIQGMIQLLSSELSRHQIAPKSDGHH